MIADSPDRVTAEFLDEHAISTVVHGDDLSPEGAEAIYGPAVASGRFAYVARTGTISTTQVISRVLDAVGAVAGVGDTVVPAAPGRAAATGE